MSSKEALSAEERAERERTRVLIISRSFDLLTKMAEWVLKAISWRIFLIAAGTYIATLALLPSESRLEVAAKFLRAVEDLAAPAIWVQFLGWIVTTVLIVVGGPYVIWSERRVNQLGERLRSYEEADEPGRLSSRDPARLQAYAKERAAISVAPPGSEVRQRLDPPDEDGSAEVERGEGVKK